jgi:hypothetical protein
MSKEISTHAMVAKRIKNELHEAFPSIKFIIRSDTSSVHICWTDGPLMEQVEKVVCKYVMGFYDSMNDCFEYDNVRKDIPQVKYVFTTRVMSPESYQKIKEKIEKEFDIDFSDQNAVFNKFKAWPNQVIWREFYKTAK